MEKKFTQGEWKHVNDSPYHRVELVNGRLYVASVEGALNESEEQANAKLISAAPDLLDALIQLRDAVKAEPSMNHHKYDALGILVNNAIKKATT